MIAFLSHTILLLMVLLFVVQDMNKSLQSSSFKIVPTLLERNNNLSWLLQCIFKIPANFAHFAVRSPFTVLCIDADVDVISPLYSPLRSI